MKAETNARSSYRNLIYTALIITAVAVALAFPGLFTTIGDFPLKKLIVPLLQIIMLGMGTTMSIKDFEGVIQQPRAVFIGVVCHFLIMPLLGFTLANTFSFPRNSGWGSPDRMLTQWSGFKCNVLHRQSQRTAFHYSNHLIDAIGPIPYARTDETAGG